MKLDYAKEAAEQAETIDAWWTENRSKNRALFAEELFAAEEHLLRAPNASPEYQVFEGRTIRRLLLRRTRYFVYYYVDETENRIRIVAISGAAMGTEPELFL